MKAVRSVLLGLVYLGLLFGTASFAEPLWVPWIAATLSIAFALAYTSYAGGAHVVALGVIAVATFLFPALVLLAIGWPHYPSLRELVTSAVATMRQHNALWGFEMFLPTVAAGIALVVMRCMRSNSTPHTDARMTSVPGQPPSARAGERGR